MPPRPSATGFSIAQIGRQHARRTKKYGKISEGIESALESEKWDSTLPAEKILQSKHTARALRSGGQPPMSAMRRIADVTRTSRDVEEV